MHESSQTISHCQLYLQLKTFKLLHLIFEARVPKISDISFVKRVFTQLNVIEEAYHEVHMTHIPQVAPPPSTPMTTFRSSGRDVEDSKENIIGEH